MKLKADFGGWATRNDLKCSDGRTIRRDAFKSCDGKMVPLIWNHKHDGPDNILGHALLENRDDGVYAYGFFNNTENGILAKELVKHGDVEALSIFANKLQHASGTRDVIHGEIKEVSLVVASANPGAFIDFVELAHGEKTDEGVVIGLDMGLLIEHSDDEGEELEVELNHADGEKPEDKTGKSVKEIIDGMSDEQKDALYLMVGAAMEADDDDEEEDGEMEHSEGGENIMKKNLFDNSTEDTETTLSHAQQMEIVELAKKPYVGSLKRAIEIYCEEHADTLAHGIDEIELLFPNYKDVHPGAPELIERDMSWVGLVMRKAHKSPVSRVRTRQADARATELRAKGYNNRSREKQLSANIKLLMRTTDPQTVYIRDELHRDDITDITDFDVVNYQKTVMRHNLEEVIALAALVGDGREDTDPDKIHEDHIRSIWHDDELYCIHADVDIDAARAELQGTNTGANFGENYVYAEAVITAALYAREKYKGKGTPDFYCDPHLLNVMLLARDLNGRRIYDSVSDLAKALNVGEITTVEQMRGLTRVDDDNKTHKLLGLFVNMANYQFGSTKGGEITNFEDFDIDFNKYKYLMETRLSGALTEVYSAIALEELVKLPASA